MKLDDFDAVFRSSVKDRFHLAPPAIESVLLVTDMLPSDAAALETTIKTLMSAIIAEECAWRTIEGDEYSSHTELLELLNAENPSLVVCYRHLLGPVKELEFSLGSVVDTLTQSIDSPVLLLPPPTRANFDVLVSSLHRVLVITDHLSGDERLVNWGVQFCDNDGVLYLAHVEDQSVFDRYMEVVSMIPDIDTDETMERIRKKLLQRPTDYIEDIARVLEPEKTSESLSPVVLLGHPATEYRRIATENDVHLIVMNTKDEKQRAMLSTAYAVAVDIQDRMLLLL